MAQRVVPFYTVNGEERGVGLMLMLLLRAAGCDGTRKDCWPVFDMVKRGWHEAIATMPPSRRGTR